MGQVAALEAGAVGILQELVVAPSSDPGLVRLAQECLVELTLLDRVSFPPLVPVVPVVPTLDI